jgi:Tfp pilus assembly protein PilN
VPFRELLIAVSQTVPDNVTLTNLSIQSKAKPAKGEPQTNGENELQIKGLAFGSDLRCLTALARIIEGLEKSPLLKNAKLTSADENKSYNHLGIGFEIICDIDINHSPLTQGELSELAEEND